MTNNDLVLNETAVEVVEETAKRFSLNDVKGKLPEVTVALFAVVGGATVVTKGIKIIKEKKPLTKVSNSIKGLFKKKETECVQEAELTETEQ